jgi:hypothetical protein
MTKKKTCDGGMDMMSEKIVESTSKDDMMRLYSMKLDKKVVMTEIKLNYPKKMREMLKKKSKFFLFRDF